MDLLCLFESQIQTFVFCQGSRKSSRSQFPMMVGVPTADPSSQTIRRTQKNGWCSGSSPIIPNHSPNAINLKTMGLRCLFESQFQTFVFCQGSRKSSRNQFPMMVGVPEADPSPQSIRRTQKTRLVLRKFNHHPKPFTERNELENHGLALLACEPNYKLGGFSRIPEE